jgi:hypothetical protein
VAQTSNRIWHPRHDIVFGSNVASRSQTSVRGFSSPASAIVDQELTSEAHADDPYILTGSYENSNDGGKSQAFVAPRGRESDDTWSPSTVAASQELERVARKEVSKEKTPKNTTTSLQDEEDDGEALHPALSYTISPTLLEEAKNAAPGTLESFWSHRMYTGPGSKKVKVHYCRSKNTTERVLQNYFMDKDILGFDIEWKPEASKRSGIKKNVALIQIASEDRIALFHISLFTGNKIEDLVAPSLKQIMENPDVTKVGVAIKADCTRMANFLDIKCKGIFELSHLYRLVKYYTSGNVGKVNKVLVSLALQVQEHLGLPLYKGDSVRGSDWSQPLDMDQIMYAASDSYAGFMLYDTLEAKRKSIHPTPPRPYHAELNIPIRLAPGVEIETSEEAAEELEPEVKTGTLTKRKGSALQASEVQIEQDTESPTVKSRNAPREKPRSLIDAEDWAHAYRDSHPIPVPAVSIDSSVTKSSKPPPSVTFSVLRTYSLWHSNPELSISDIANILRNPPLQEATVNQYILEAVRIEKLPVDKSRLTEVLNTLPESAKEQYRYRTLLKLASNE